MFDMYMVTERTTEAPIPSSEMELLAPTLGAENLEEDVELRVSISKPVIPTREIPTREMPELVAYERPPQDNMAHEVIPPAIVPEATTLVASRAVPEVSATNLLRELPQLSLLQLMEGRAFIVHILEVPTSICIHSPSQYSPFVR